MSTKRTPGANIGQHHTGSSVDGSGASRLLYTVQEAAAKLNVPPSWLYARTRTDEIPLRRLGKYIRFTDDDVAAIAANGAPSLKNGVE
jgi:excisionase family DNA binding protein